MPKNPFDFSDVEAPSPKELEKGFKKAFDDESDEDRKKRLEREARQQALENLKIGRSNK